MLAGARVPAGWGTSTALPDMDFETYSEAGMVWDERAQKWLPLDGCAKKGLEAVGAAVYSEHPSTEVLCLQYDLKDGKGSRLWVPGLMENPEELFAHIESGGLLEAHNSMFEFLIWNNVCTRIYGWPELPLKQLRCSASKCRAFSLPSKLAQVGEALDTKYKKLEDGRRLINKFSRPRNPTKKDPRVRHRPASFPEDQQKLYEYCLYDIRTEADTSSRVPDLLPHELDLWLCDQTINARGCAIDVESVRDCITLVEAVAEKYNRELLALTSGAVQTASQRDRILKWCDSRGFDPSGGLKADEVEYYLTLNLPDDVRRVLEIRAILGGAAVKKLYAMSRRACSDDRVRDILLFCGADRTGRFAGRGPQPQNLPNSGPKVLYCETCGSVRAHGEEGPCACGGVLAPKKWGVEQVEAVLRGINSGCDLESFEAAMGPDPIGVISGCLRSMFIAKDGYDLICSDYSAIEAVVLACMAGEQWRIDVFNSHGKIYEMSAAAISGTPFEEMMALAGYTDLTAPNWWEAPQTGPDHPLRKTLGKVAELASGYGGGRGAWKNFGADEFMSDEEIENAKKEWRRKSPKIVNFWYALERCAHQAVQNPGHDFETHGLLFGAREDVLYIRLLSGRILCYHSPRLEMVTKWGRQSMELSYMGVDGYTKKWSRLTTYGGKLCENVIQATARDIMTHALVNLEKSGYPVVLHIHDEIVSEVPIGSGSIEEFEKIMENTPAWCSHWPIRADGGWRGKRYRK